MRKLILLAAFLFINPTLANINQYENPLPFDLVIDAPGTNIKHILFQGGKNAYKLQESIINEFPKVKFDYIYFSKLGKLPDIIKNNKNVSIHTFPREITYWAQDRYFRFTKNEKSLLMPVLSSHMFDDDVLSSFELAIPKFLENSTSQNLFYKKTNAFYDKHLYPVSIDKSNGYPYPHSKRKNFFQAHAWNDSFGDGGDRITTQKYLFVGINTYKTWVNKIKPASKLGSTSEVHRYLESLLKKIILPIGNINQPDVWNQYFYHIDLYATPIELDNKVTVVLGSIDLALKILKNQFNKLPDWVDLDKIKLRNRHYQATKAYLENDLNIKVLEIPLLPVLFGDNKKGILSFNNGVFSGNTFYLADYNFQEQSLNQAVSFFKNETNKVFNSLKLDVKYLAGGEDVIHEGGSLRCMTSVLNN